MGLNDFVSIHIAGLPVELSMLFLASLLGLAQLIIAGRANNGERGLKWNLGARDGEPPPVGAIAGRLERARRNFMETFPFFAVGILLAALANRFNGATLWGSALYFWARVLYVPLYTFGVFGLRTLVWLVSLIGILLVFAGIMWPRLLG